MYPALAAAGIAGIVGLLVFSYGNIPAQFLTNLLVRLEIRVKHARLQLNAGIVLLCATVAMLAVTTLIVLVSHPPILIGIVLYLAAAAAAVWETEFYLNFLEGRRQKKFVAQLDMVLRTLASALQAGLGLQQAVVLMSHDLEEPARYEFQRLVGRTNIGFSILDTFDELATRMPSGEMTMAAQVIRIHAQTGGDLAGLLHHVADTVRARRTLQRKLQSLTSEQRLSAWVILALPILLGSFIILVQPQMGHALVFTTIGRVSLAIAVGLELTAWITMNKVMEFNP
ncbi:MAG: type II secretion system F family protein [Vulcanimicrobiaceae bacterium]|jgi:tight adherence protein B